MKIKDIFNGLNGIAAIFAAAFAVDFTAFFGAATAATVDTWIIFKHGEETISDKITVENATEIIRAIISMKIETWRKMYAALTANYNAATIAETKTKSGTLARVGENSQTDTAAKKAFNDTEFADDTQNETIGENSTTDTYNLTETTNRTPSNVAENVSKEITLRQRNNLQIAIVDSIIKEITINIY